MVESFESAVIIISVLFSLWSIVVFVAEGQEIGFEAKDLVGSQRFGFIYLVAIWAVYLNPARWMTLVKAKYAILLILIGGLLLTFSRASIAGLVVSAALFVVSRQWEWMRQPTLRGIGRALGAAVGAAVVVTVLYTYLPLTFTFFGERLFNVVRSAEAVESQLLDPETSVGTRVVILRRIVEFVLRNPVTGTGYLGVWVLPDTPAESAHNQYSDTLLRTGLIGFGAYVYLLWRVVRYLRSEHQHLFWGIVAVLTYGLFHETFKESQGAFLLAFLLGMTAQGWRERARVRPAPRSTALSYPMPTSGTTVAARAGGAC
jgi:O-antigen ligase